MMKKIIRFLGLLIIVLTSVGLAGCQRQENSWQAIKSRGTLVIGVITTIFGIVLIFSPFSGDAITKFAGAFLVIVAIFDLIDNYILQK